ncbi:MAG TPA: excinuclease ABC subunit UvrC [Thermoanaerobaculia bacterium]|jgi:excinuclease ABC subunit C|nr:excinuclease ABC subunit UvrC [Thermoanaerobaculia bacterium]
MSSHSEHLTQRVRELPDRPGIYIFKDVDGKVLYVGKATSLRKRVSSYFSRDHEPRLAALVHEAADVEYVVTDSPAEALLLENNWIKSKRPRYNILLRDDKTYPYIKLTLADDYPRIAFTRRISNDKSDYFGPFLPGGLARKAIKLVQKLFQIRVCRIEIDGSLPRPCLYYDMHRCLGPCAAGLTTKAAYDEAVQQARLFLSGRNEQLLRRLKKEMWEASEDMDFERAAQIRDTLTEVEATSQRRKLSSVEGEDLDVYGVHVGGGNAAIAVLIMRGGQVLDRRELFWEGVGDISHERLLSEVLPQLYDRTTFIPKEIHLPVPIEGEEALLEWLCDKKGEKVYVRLPSRGPKAERVALAMHNAELAHKRRFRGVDEHPGAASLARHLDFEAPPRRIEGFDISHFQGGETVASMVVWEEGRMRKGEYRSFNIRDIRQPDDFASIHQAVDRRYRRRLEEIGEMPDLILIDGGRGQLNAALDALANLGVEETPIVSLAKREEEIYIPGLPEPLRLERNDFGLRLLQEIRDESHRFAVSKHRSRRSARTLRSKLDELAGIGPGRRKKLINHFGSAEGVRNAPLEDLQGVLGKVMGQKIFQQLHPPVDPPGPDSEPVGGAASLADDVKIP